jgi:hypothetical protein
MWEQDNYEQWTYFYHFCCYNCKSKIDKIEGYNGTILQCKWCNLHNSDMMDGNDILVECEQCENIATDGVECAYCWCYKTQPKQTTLGLSNINLLKLYHRFRKVHESDAGEKYVWYNFMYILIEQARELPIWNKNILLFDKRCNPEIYLICTNRCDGGTVCNLVLNWKLPVQTGRCCDECRMQMYVHSFDCERITNFKQDLIDGLINLHGPRSMENNLETAMRSLREIDGFEVIEWVKTINFIPRGKDHAISALRSRWGSPSDLRTYVHKE